MFCYIIFFSFAFLWYFIILTRGQPNLLILTETIVAFNFLNFFIELHLFFACHFYGGRCFEVTTDDAQHMVPALCSWITSGRLRGPFMVPGIEPELVMDKVRAIPAARLLWPCRFLFPIFHYLFYCLLIFFLILMVKSFPNYSNMSSCCYLMVSTSIPTHTGPTEPSGCLWISYICFSFYFAINSAWDIIVALEISLRMLLLHLR